VGLTIPRYRGVETTERLAILDGIDHLVFDSTQSNNSL
jgi:hypothetical protein